MSYAVRYCIALAACSAALVVVIANRPEKRPGNLAPIQLITALGSWALIVINCVLVGVACTTGFVSLAILPIVTIVSAVVRFSNSARNQTSERAAPDPFNVAVGEIRALLGGARRLGLAEIDAVLVAGGPQIGVDAPASGRVVVRVHESVLAWVDRHRRTGAGEATIGSFIRFAVLHELGHILNGDHRTYRFARAVLTAHLWWLLSSLTVPFAIAARNLPAAFMIVTASEFIAIFVAVQSLIARRFIAERERLADWRAIQCLSTEDASRLLRRSGTRRTGRQRPTEIEKLMNDLKAEPRRARGLSRFSSVVRLLWPEGDSIHRRAEALAGDRAGTPAQPVRWAALTGMQCGVLATAAVMGILLAVGPVQVAVLFPGVMIVMAWFGGAPGTYCVLKADPARISIDAGARTRHRFATGLMFMLTFLSGVFVTDCFASILRISGWIPGVAFVAAAMSAPVIMVGCAWLSDLLGDQVGGSGFRVAPHEHWTFAVPLVAAVLIVLFPLNIAISEWLGLGSFFDGSWVAVMLCSVAAYLLSTVMARSTNATLREAAPMAVLDASAPVYGYRFFWRDFYVDLARCAPAKAGFIALAFQTAALPPFVLVFAFVMSTFKELVGFNPSFTVFFVLSLAMFSLVIVVPDRNGTLHPRLLRLIDRNGLELFLALLESARRADGNASERLRQSLALRLPSDHAVMTFLLPRRKCLWVLPGLFSFIRVARTAGALNIIDGALPQIEAALRDLVTDDAVAIAPGEPPSLFYSALVAAIANETDLACLPPFQRISDRVLCMLTEQLSGQSVHLIADVVIAARLLHAQHRPFAEAMAIRHFVERSTLMSMPTRAQSLVELCDLADLLGDARQMERLAPVVRSRMWEILQLNPRKEVLALLDCYLAAVRLGEGDSPLASAAAVIISEIATRTADELMNVQLREA